MLPSAKTKKIFFIIYLAALHLLAGFFVYDKLSDLHGDEISKKDAESVSPVVPLPTPLTIPYDGNNIPPELKPAETAAPTQTPNYENAARLEKLMIPVVGIKPDNLQDTYTDSRSENRVHNAIDIMAPGGTPVVAAADGEIVKFLESKLGGITIYQLSADKKFIYYYAHLQKRADNLQEKSFVKRGTVIGYVGDTGNAGTGNFHLHFSISIPRDPERYWEGENINPFPILKQGIEAASE